MGLCLGMKMKKVRLISVAVYLLRLLALCDLAYILKNEITSSSSSDTPLVSNACW